MDSSDLRTWARPVLYGGGLSFLVFMAVAIGVGRVGDREALSLLESTLPTLRFLCSSAIGASATVVALMVTVLGLSFRMDSKLRPEYFDRIGLIGALCVGVMAGAVTLLLVLCVPLGETEEFTTWYSAIYYSVLTIASLLGGALVATTVALRTVVVSLVAAAHPDSDSGIVVSDE